MIPFLSSRRGKSHSKEIDREDSEAIIFSGGPVGAAGEKK